MINNQKPLPELLEFSILNLNKPSGPTSFDISDFVRNKLKDFGIRKTSHFGTLDPKVTGVLPIALNRACKLTGFFLGHDKEYVGIMRLHEDVELEKIKKIIKEKFLGKIKQTPPVKSRVKREEREREIISFEILEQDENEMQGQKSLRTSPKHGQSKDILFKAKVQGGTYIRKLIDDLGKELGVGAHMLELRRTGAGIFSEEDESFIDLYKLEKIAKAVALGDNRVINEKFKKLDKIKSAGYVEGYINNKKISEQSEPNSGREGGVEELRKILIPAEDALKKIFPIVQVNEKSVKRLLTGKPIIEDDLLDYGKLVNGKISLDNKISKSSIKTAVKIKNINNNKIIANKSEQQIMGGNSMSLDRAKINEGKFIAFCEDKFIGIYDSGKPLFVLQEIK